MPVVNPPIIKNSGTVVDGPFYDINFDCPGLYPQPDPDNQQRSNVAISSGTTTTDIGTSNYSSDEPLTIRSDHTHELIVPQIYKPTGNVSSIGPINTLYPIRRVPLPGSGSARWLVFSRGIFTVGFASTLCEFALQLNDKEIPNSRFTYNNYVAASLIHHMNVMEITAEGGQSLCFAGLRDFSQISINRLRLVCYRIG